MREMFGPIIYVVATQGTEQSLQLAKDSAIAHGALTWLVYTTDDDTMEAAIDAAVDAGVSGRFQSRRRALCESIGGVQRLSRDRGKPCGQRIADRPRVRRWTLPRGWNQDFGMKPAMAGNTSYWLSLEVT